MNCLGDDDLTRYIDDEMSMSERNEFEGHLDSCHFCRHRLEEGVKSEQALHRGLASFSEAADHLGLSACSRLSRERLVIYLNKGLTAEETREVEHHLQTCNTCLADLNLLVRIKKRSAAAPLAAVPQNLMNLVQEEWQNFADRGLEVAGKESVVQLVIGLVTKGLEILSDSIIPSGITVTSLMAATPTHAFRSLDEENLQTEIEALFFEWQVEGTEVKLELTLRKQKDDRVTLITKLSKKNAPLPHVRISLFRDRVLLESRKTGPDGHAELTVPQPGKYSLRILREAIEWPIEIKKL